MAEFRDLEGKIISKIEVGAERVDIHTECGKNYAMYHCQDCCESVVVEDVNGDVNEILGQSVIRAEERTDEDWDIETDHYYDDYHTWTFYVIETIKETVTIRWFGTSNGYYSESVDFVEI